jgi:hypothetical protein
MGAFDSPVNTQGAFDYSVLRADYEDAMLSNSCGIGASVIPAMLMVLLKERFALACLPVNWPVVEPIRPGTRGTRTNKPTLYTVRRNGGELALPSSKQRAETAEIACRD